MKRKILQAAAGRRGSVFFSSGSSAPLTEQFVVMALSGTLPNERKLTAGASISVTDGGAGGNVTIANTAPEATAVSNVGGATGQVYRDMTGATINLKTVAAGTGMSVTNGVDTVTVTCTITQGPTGSGTVNYLALWTAATVLGNSQIYQDGTYPLNLDVNGVASFKFKTTSTTGSAGNYYYSNTQATQPFLRVLQIASADPNTRFGIARANCSEILAIDSSSLIIGSWASGATRVPIYIGQKTSGVDEVILSIDNTGLFNVFTGATIVRQGGAAAVDDLLTLSNTRAATGITGTAILFKFEEVTTPALVNAGRYGFIPTSSWTSTLSTQNSAARVDIAVQGVMTPMIQVGRTMIELNRSGIDSDTIIYMNGLTPFVTFDAGIGTAFFESNRTVTFGTSAAAPKLEIYSNGTNGYINAKSDGSIYIQCYNSAGPVVTNYSCFGPQTIEFNVGYNDVDIELRGDNSKILSTDGYYDELKISAFLLIDGIIDNSGNAYTGGTSASPTAIDIHGSDYGAIVRVAPTSNTNNWYRLSDPNSHQICIIENEGDYPARIMVYDGVSSTWTYLIPSRLSSSAGDSFIILRYSPTARNGSGAWSSCGARQYGECTALTDAATIAVDAQLGPIYDITLTSSRTLGNPSNPQRCGQMAIFRIRQGGSGSYTLTFDTKYRFSTALPSSTLSTAVGKLDYLGFMYNLTDDKWDYVSEIKGFN